MKQKTMDDDKLSQIERLLPQTAIEQLTKIALYRESDGAYHLYGKYVVVKNQDNTYTVSVSGTYTVKNFYKLKNAAAWCSYDIRAMHRQSSRLHQLDQLIFGIDTEIFLHTGLMNRTKDDEQKLIYLSKLTQEKAKKKNFLHELGHFISAYQMWQTNMFDSKPKY